MMKKTWLAIVVLAVMLSGCSRDEKPKQGAWERFGGTARGTSASGKLAVELVPAALTAKTEIQAIVSGAAVVIYRWEKNGQVLQGEKADKLAVFQFTKGDRITVTVTAGAESASATALIGNSPPEVTGVTLGPQYIYRGVDIIATAAGVDIDGDLVQFSYRWVVNGEEISETSQTLRGDAFKRGDRIWIRVTPFDSDGTGKVYEPLPITIPNAPPRFVSQPSTEFKGDTYTYTARATDPDGDAITYSLAAGPPGMTVNPATGEVAWKIGKGAAGTHAVELNAQDSEGFKIFQKYSLNVTIPQEEKK